MGQGDQSTRNHRSVTLTFHAFSANAKATCDPNHFIFAKRVMDLRRCWFKSPYLQTMMREIWDHYQDAHMPGTELGPKAFAFPLPRDCKILKKKNWPAWKWPHRPCGPLGLLLQQCGQRAAKVSTEFLLSSHYTCDCNIFSDPL